MNGRVHATDGDIDDMLVFEAEDQYTCLTDREFCGSVFQTRSTRHKKQPGRAV